MSIDLSESFNKTNASPKGTGLTYYNPDSSVRNVYFVRVGGSEVFLNYAILHAGEISPGKDTITLTFNTHTVTLKGRNLSDLFNRISVHGVRRIEAVEERYAVMEETESIVTQIEVEEIS